jgi:hypothetical protein
MMNDLLRIQPVRLATSLLLCALAGCTAKTASGPTTISDLSISPATATVATQTTFTGTFELADPGGDETEIDATIALPGGQPMALPPTMLQGNTGATVSPVEFLLPFAPPSAGTYTVTVFIKNSDGTSSNTLTGTITAQ